MAWLLSSQVDVGLILLFDSLVPSMINIYIYCDASSLTQAVAQLPGQICRELLVEFLLCHVSHLPKKIGRASDIQAAGHRAVVTSSFFGGSCINSMLGNARHTT